MTSPKSVGGSQQPAAHTQQSVPLSEKAAVALGREITKYKNDNPATLMGRIAKWVKNLCRPEGGPFLWRGEVVKALDGQFRALDSLIKSESPENALDDKDKGEISASLRDLRGMLNQLKGSRPVASKETQDGIKRLLKDISLVENDIRGGPRIIKEGETVQKKPEKQVPPEVKPKEEGQSMIAKAEELLAATEQRAKEKALQAHKKTEKMPTEELVVEKAAPSSKVPLKEQVQTSLREYITMAYNEFQLRELDGTVTDDSWLEDSLGGKDSEDNQELTRIKERDYTGVSSREILADISKALRITERGGLTGKTQASDKSADMLKSEDKIATSLAKLNALQKLFTTREAQKEDLKQKISTNLNALASEASPLVKGSLGKYLRGFSSQNTELEAYKTADYTKLHRGQIAGKIHGLETLIRTGFRQKEEDVPESLVKKIEALKADLTSLSQLE